jgi:hypothetical protein
MRNAHTILIGKPQDKNHWNDQGIGAWITLK